MIVFLLKGLLRDRSRSFFPVIMVAAGVFTTVFLQGWVTGVFDNMIGANARFSTGHVKVMTKAYRKEMDQSPNDLALTEASGLITALKSAYPDMIWLPRIKFGAIMDVPDSEGNTRTQGPVFAMAMDLLSEDPKDLSLLNIKESIVNGSLPKKEDEVLLSSEFADNMDLKVGDTATLISSTMYGSMAVFNVTVSGTVRFGVTAMDRGTVLTDIKYVSYALDMDDSVSEILGFKKDMIYSEDEMLKLCAEFNQEYIKSKDEFAPVMISLSDQNGLGEYVRLGKMFGKIITLIFMIAMAVVLWNVGLINGLRRYGEVGIRLAMGEEKGLIYRSMLSEAALIGVAGSFLGTLLGLALCYYLQNNGFDFGYLMKQSSMMIYNELSARVTPVTYYIGFIPGVLASVLGTAFAGIGIFRRDTAALFKELEV